jgi:hypothetical protein
VIRSSGGWVVVDQPHCSTTADVATDEELPPEGCADEPER